MEMYTHGWFYCFTVLVIYIPLNIVTVLLVLHSSQRIECSEGKNHLDKNHHPKLVSCVFQQAVFELR